MRPVRLSLMAFTSASSSMMSFIFSGFGSLPIQLPDDSKLPTMKSASV